MEASTFVLYLAFGPLASASIDATAVYPTYAECISASNVAKRSLPSKLRAKLRTVCIESLMPSAPNSAPSPGNPLPLPPETPTYPDDSPEPPDDSPELPDDSPEWIIIPEEDLDEEIDEDDLEEYLGD